MLIRLKTTNDESGEPESFEKWREKWIRGLSLGTTFKLHRLGKRLLRNECLRFVGEDVEKFLEEDKRTVKGEYTQALGLLDRDSSHKLVSAWDECKCRRPSY